MLYGGVCHSDLYFIDDKVQLGGGKVFKHSDVLGKSIFDRGAFLR